MANNYDYFTINKNIGTLTIHEGTLFIHPDRFRDNKTYSIVNIPSSVTSIGHRAFLDNYLSSVRLNDGLEIIEECAFCRCGLLKSITIPSSVTSIGKCAFSNCKKLNSVTFIGDNTTIDKTTFINCNEGNTVSLYCSERFYEKNVQHFPKNFIRYFLILNNGV